jgi:glucose-6-phosphate isomerase, archaeal
VELEPNAGVIVEQRLSINWATGLLSGTDVQNLTKTLGQIRSVFHDQDAASKLPAELELYRIQFYAPVADGTEGGLYWGNTIIQPGKVGDEYYMTKGHFHRIHNRAEYYATVQGEGALLLMDEDGLTRCESMGPGSVHYIPGNTAHRAANIGSVPLVFIASWPSDAGHDYETIEREGFGARVVERNGSPVLVPRG